MILLHHQQRPARATVRMISAELFRLEGAAMKCLDRKS
jgi:hypothetical protein